MTPKEKAKELLDRYRTNVVMWSGGVEVEEANVRQCALIAVREIITNCTWKKSTYEKWGFTWVDEQTTIEYWMEVKECIEIH